MVEFPRTADARSVNAMMTATVGELIEAVEIDQGGEGTAWHISRHRSIARDRYVAAIWTGLRLAQCCTEAGSAPA